MSIEFRQRTPAEYLRMLWRHKLLIILPALAMTLAVGWVVRKLPSVWESRSLLVYRPSSISPTLVKRLDDSDLMMRLQTISQVITSRSSLEPLITRYNLYQRERASGVPIERLIERMQAQDIRIAMDTGASDSENAFRISFRGDDARTTQAVTAELTSKVVNAQTQEAFQNVQRTRELFESQLNEQRAKLDAIEARRRSIMEQSAQFLPQSASVLSSQLEGLRQRQASLTTEIGRLNDMRTQLSQQSTIAERARVQAIDEVENPIDDPTKSAAFDSLLSRANDLRGQLQNLLTTLRPKHPDVVAKRNEIADVEQQMNAMKADYERRIQQRRAQIASRPDIQGFNIQQNIKQTVNEMGRLQQELGSIGGQIANIEARLNNVPMATVALDAVEREYNTEKSIYDEVLRKKNEADLASQVAQNAQGETIQVIDSANLPTQPVAPNRPMLTFLGFLFGLGLGFMFAVLRELPRLLSVQTTADAEHYTGLPVLISVPEILTGSELRRRRLRQAATVVAGIALTALSVPVLIIVLRFTRVFEILAGVS